MSIRDRLPQKPLPASTERLIPKWASEGSSTTKALYKATESEYRRISKLVESSRATNHKDTNLVFASIAKIAGKHRSILNTRRQPELCDWINRLNDDLDKLSKLHKPISSGKKSKSKRALEHELAVLRKKISEFNESERRNIVEQFFNSNLLDDRDKMAREISRLRLENAKLLDKTTSLQNLNKQLSREVAEHHQKKNRTRTLKSVLSVVDEP